MTSFDRGRPVLEGGWVLTGGNADGPPVKLVLGETELSQAYLGVIIGRHPGLCDRVIDDPGISRRHLRVGLADGGLFAEDLNSLNGTLLDGEAIQPFQPEPLDQGQALTLGQVVLTVSRLSNEAA
jgi:predicted component of type VI protein secretion system